MSKEDALYLVDGSNFLFRAYHALPPLTTKLGVPSGAVFGFTQMLIRLEMEHKPKHLAVVFDAGARTFRHDLYGGYKANRPPPPDDLIPQFALVREVVESFGVRVLDARNVEADDLIATLARRAKEAGQRVVIVSSDKDLMQLVDERTVLLDTMKNVTYDVAGVTAKFGVPPVQLGDLLALMGDSIDNVPGIPGVGPKTAAALVQGFGSVEQLIARVDEIAALKGLRGAASVGEKVRLHADAVRLSRRLVTLDEEALLEVTLGANRVTLRAILCASGRSCASSSFTGCSIVSDPPSRRPRCRWSWRPWHCLRRRQSRAPTSSRASATGPSRSSRTSSRSGCWPERSVARRRSACRCGRRAERA